jgi:predicted unusual protein kinase regulating ubiquinone biosynthesis (AarF/ABC1/UbiB family)
VAPRAERSPTRADAQAVALTEELGAQLLRMKGAGAKLVQFLSMLALQREPSQGALGTLRDGAQAVPFARVRKVVERDLGAPIRELFADVDEEPLALASLGQVHRARTVDGADVAIKVQHPDVAEAVEADLRNLGLVSPLMKRVAPGADAGALLAEVCERVSDELDYEIEAQHQRRLERRFRGHPHVRVARVHTELSTRRVLVTDYVEGLGAQEIEGLADAERDRVGELVFRFFFGLAWRDGVVAGDPHPDNCLLCADGRLCLLDFGLLRDLEADYIEGERAVMQAIAAGDPRGVHDGLSRLGYLPEPEAVDADALLDHLATASDWLLGRGLRRLERGDVDRIVELGYPPRSPWFGQMRRLRMPPPTLLLRRMEVQVLAVLGELRAGADWGAIAAEHHGADPPATELGREDRAFFARRARR